MLKTELIAMPMPIAMHTKELPFAMVKTVVAIAFVVNFKQLIGTSVLGSITTEVLVVVVVRPIMVLAIGLAGPIVAVAILELVVVVLRPMAVTALVVVTEQLLQHWQQPYFSSVTIVTSTTEHTSIASMESPISFSFAT
jgi:hypothetical protein